MKNLPKNIKILRTARGWNQSDLDKELGVVATARLESGKVQNPGTMTLKRIADVFGVTIDTLLGDISKSLPGG